MKNKNTERLQDTEGELDLICLCGGIGRHARLKI